MDYDKNLEWEQYLQKKKKKNCWPASSHSYQTMDEILNT